MTNHSHLNKTTADSQYSICYGLKTLRFYAFAYVACMWASNKQLGR